MTTVDDLVRDALLFPTSPPLEEIASLSPTEAQAWFRGMAAVPQAAQLMTTRGHELAVASSIAAARTSGSPVTPTDIEAFRRLASGVQQT